MAGPSIEEWILQLDLRMVQDPDLDKPVYRKNYSGGITFGRELEKRIGRSLRQARTRRKLSGSKIASLVGLTDQVYFRYETAVSHLTVGRLLHLCEVLGVSPEEILIPAAPDLWGATEEAARISMLFIEKIRRLDLELLRAVYNLIKDLPDQNPQGGCGDNGADPAARLLPGPDEPTTRVSGDDRKRA